MAVARGDGLLMAPGGAPSPLAELEPVEAVPRGRLPFTYGAAQEALVGAALADAGTLTWEYDEVAQRNVVSDDEDAIWMAVEWGGGTCAATADAELPADLDAGGID